MQKNSLHIKWKWFHRSIDANQNRRTCLKTEDPIVQQSVPGEWNNSILCKREDFPLEQAYS